MNKPMRSDNIKSGKNRAPHRSLLYALGLTEAEMDRPFIAVINSFNEIVPGHIHLNEIAAQVKDGIRLAGGVPFEVPAIAVCDGLAMNHDGMHYSLVSRDYIADSCEIVLQAHMFDGVVFIPNCDKVVPGMLMAAARLDLPSIFVSGGPMLPGDAQQFGRMGLMSVFEALGAESTGKITADDLCTIEQSACPTCGSCSGMYTANTMNCLTEAMGMGLPGNGTIAAVLADRRRLAKEAGMKVLDLVAEQKTARAIMTKENLENALRVDMALGGSTNSVLHMLAISHEADCPLTMSEIEEYSATTPQLCKLDPAGTDFITDLNANGGISAVMAELAKQDLINKNVRTVDGTMEERLKGNKGSNGKVIRSITDPVSQDGGLAVLSGNIAPEGCVVKKAPCCPKCWCTRGRQECLTARKMRSRRSSRIGSNREMWWSSVLKGQKAVRACVKC